MASSLYKKKPKVFIMGLSSFVGYHLACSLRKDFTVVGCYFSNQVNIPDVHAYPVSLKNDTEMLERLVGIQRPDICIASVGIADVKTVIENPKLADNINVTLPLAFSLMALRNRAKHVLINSSDVFDGLKGNYEEENKDFAALGYAKMKVTIEAYIRAQTMEGTTIRLGRVLGMGHPYRLNFVDDIRSKLQGDRVCFADEKKTSSWLTIGSAVKGIHEILHLPFPPNKQRILHLGGPAANEFEMAQIVALSLGLPTKNLKPNPKSETLLNLTLNSKITESQIKWRPETKEQLLENFLREMKPGLNTPSHALKVVLKKGPEKKGTKSAQRKQP